MRKLHGLGLVTLLTTLSPAGTIAPCAYAGESSSAAKGSVVVPGKQSFLGTETKEFGALKIKLLECKNFTGKGARGAAIHGTATMKVSLGDAVVDSLQLKFHESRHITLGGQEFTITNVEAEQPDAQFDADIKVSVP